MNIKLITRAFSFLSMAGVGITSFVSVKCSKKAEKAETTGEKVKAYAPAIASGAATCACIFVTGHVPLKAAAGLAASASYLAANRDKVQKKLEQVVGKEESKKLIAEADKETAREILPWEGPSIEYTGNGEELFLEGWSGRLFYSSQKAVQEAQDKINEQYRAYEEVFLNDYYRALGIVETRFGDLYYWDRNECVGMDQECEWIHFHSYTTINEDGRSMIVLDIFDDPKEYRWYNKSRY